MTILWILIMYKTTPLSDHPKLLNKLTVLVYYWHERVLKVSSYNSLFLNKLDTQISEIKSI